MVKLKFLLSFCIVLCSDISSAQTIGGLKGLSIHNVSTVQSAQIKSIKMPGGEAGYIDQIPIITWPSIDSASMAVRRDSVFDKETNKVINEETKTLIMRLKEEDRENFFAITSILVPVSFALSIDGNVFFVGRLAEPIKNGEFVIEARFLPKSVVEKLHMISAKKSK